MKLLYFEDFQICAQTLAIDPAFIDATRDALIRSGLADLLGLDYKPPHTDDLPPRDFTAIEVGVFLNPQPEKKRNRKEIQRIRLPHGAQINVWDRTKIEFGKTNQIAWAGEFFLHNASDAKIVAAELQTEQKISADTVASLHALTEAMPSAMFGVVRKRIGTARKVVNMLAVAEVASDGTFDRLILAIGNEVILHVTGDQFASSLANGAEFKKNVVAQLRAGRNGAFDPWSSTSI